MFTNAESAILIAPNILQVFNNMGGYFVVIDTVHVWFRWTQYISPVKYALEAMVWNEFGDKELPPGSPNPLEYFGMRLSYGICVGVMVAITLFFRVASVIFLKRLVNI